MDFQEFYLARGDVDQLKSLDGRFHEIIYASCGSMILRDTLSPLHKKIQSTAARPASRRSRAAQSVRSTRRSTRPSPPGRRPGAERMNAAASTTPSIGALEQGGA